MLLDDIASILDDVALMTKKAAAKTAGVLGDDLALNAQQVSGVVSNREFPIVLAVAKGSIVNKAILVPAALAISRFAPWLVTPLLMLGGLYLCYEGVEKLVHQFLHRHDKKPVEEMVEIPVTPAERRLDEKAKIKGAIRTDFVLSAEIIVISLGVVAKYPLATQAMTMALIAIIMTLGVYGVVAAIVKLDDLGLYLSKKTPAAARACASAILWAAPYLMKLLSVAGTVAMFLVGGGILTHGVAAVHRWVDHIWEGGGIAGSLFPAAMNAIIGVLAGAVVLLLVTGVKKLLGKQSAH